MLIDLSGQLVNTTRNTSVSTPTSMSLDLSKPTSIFNSNSVVISNSAAIANSTSAVISITASSMSIQSTTAVLRTVTAASISGTNLPSTVNLDPTPLPSSTSATLSSSSPPSSSPPSPPPQSSPPPSDSTGTTLAFSTTSVQTGGPGFTVVSVTVVRPTPSMSRTVTTQPAFTLSKPLVSTSTDSNGVAHITVPPLVTIMSTSTASDGSLITTTAVVANAQPDQQATSILNNPQAVAGIFTVVGLGFAGLLVCIVFFVRRYRRNRRNKWLAGMRPQRPASFLDDPFHDDNVSPAIRSAGATTEDTHWDQKGILTPTIPRASDNHNTDLSMIRPDMYPVSFHRPENHEPQFLDVVSSTEPDRTNRRSRASTPSIYPVSFLPGEEEQVLDDIAFPNINRSATTSSNIPPRPPRSHLRDRATSFDHRLPTPSDSESSNHPSPMSETRSHDVLNRKTILDVRSRLIAP